MFGFEKHHQYVLFLLNYLFKIFQKDSLDSMLGLSMTLSVSEASP